VYGNYFAGNHREALFQASGRVSVHDNVFVDGPPSYTSLVLQKHEDVLKIAYIYNNTIYTRGRGIHFAHRATIDDAVVGNLIFAGSPMAGTIMRSANNITDLPENAKRYVAAPSREAGAADFYPLKGQCIGAPLDLSMFHTDVDYAADFNGTPKVRAAGAVVYRGAYAGDGVNPGWRLQADFKEVKARTDGVPVLAWISPAGVAVGTNRKVAISGMNFSPESAISVSGAGVSVGDVKVESSTEMTALVTVGATAAAGVRDVVVSTGESRSDPLTFRVNGHAAVPRRVKR
jgi:hypothetical protein